MELKDYADDIVHWYVYKVLKYDDEATKSIPYTIPHYKLHLKNELQKELEKRGFRVFIDESNVLILEWDKYTI